MEKVLIITYYWPPAGGPGVQRWLKFAKYLSEFGFEPIIYAPQNPDYPILDSTLSTEIPSNIRVIKKPIFEPYFLASIFSKKHTKSISSGIISEEKKQGFLQKILLFIRGNFFIPDARKFWIKPSVQFLKEYISEYQIDKIITTGPPHSMHLIGLNLKKELNVKWLADFRDPWTKIGYHKNLKLTNRSQNKHLKLEEEVLNFADKILVTSFTTQKEFENKTNTPVEIITNGFDVELNEESPKNPRFIVSHIGSLLSGRNPHNLWKVLGEIGKENNAFSKALELQLVGKVSEDVVNSIKMNGLENNLCLRGYVTHEEALGIQRNSDLLLLIEINSEETQGIIPGKLFEYMAAKRPILAIGPLNWDASRIISETNSGESFSYEERGEMKNKLLDFYHTYEKGELGVKSKNLEKYSRRNLTGRLAEVLKTL